MEMCSELKAFLVRAHHLLRKQPTFKADEIPKLYHEPGVLSGYRLPGQDLFTYVMSVLQLNNETVNVWTHLVGFIVILFRTLSFYEEFGADDRRIVPVIGFGVCCLLYTSLSVIAHTFHSASPPIHYTCFQADYAGIGLYAFGGALPVFYLGTDRDTRKTFNNWFLLINFGFAWFCFLCCCVAKLRYRRPYPFRRKLWQIIPFGSHFSMVLCLMYDRIHLCYFQGTETCDDPAMTIYSRIVALGLLAALTFSSHLPEKLWPGCFDFIGQGHHVFHVVSVILTMSQFKAFREDILKFNRDVTSDHDVIPSLSSLLLLIMTFIALSGITMLCLRPYVIKRVKEDEILEKKRN